MIDVDGVDINDAPFGYKAKLSKNRCCNCAYQYADRDCPRRTAIKYTQPNSWTEMCLPQNRLDGKRVIFISK